LSGVAKKLNISVSLVTSKYSVVYSTGVAATADAAFVVVVAAAVVTAAAVAFAAAVAPATNIGV